MKSKIVHNIKCFLLWTDLCTVAIVGNTHFNVFQSSWDFFDVVDNFAYSYSNSPRYFMLEFIISESMFQLRSFLLWTDLCTVAIGGNPYFKFSAKLGFFECFRQFCLSYSTSSGFFMLESIFFRSVLIGDFFVMDRFWTHRLKKTAKCSSLQKTSF